MEKRESYIKELIGKGTQWLRGLYNFLIKRSNSNRKGSKYHKNNKKTKYQRVIRDNRKKLAGAVMALSVVLGGSIFYFNTTTAAAYVVVDGEKMGLVESKAAGEAMLEQIFTEYGGSIDQTAKSREEVTYEQVRVKSTLYASQQVTKEDLKNRLDLYVEGYAFKVKEETVAVLPSAQDVDRVIKEYKDAYAKPAKAEKVEVSSVELIEEIKSEKLETELKDVQTPEQVLEILKQGKQTSKDYVVQENDSWWLIARKNDMLTDEVLAGNPDFTEDSTLQPGQVIKLVSVTPYLTVVSKGKYTANEVIPFDVVTKTDYSLASGQTKIKEKGSDGNKEVTYDYMQKNGKIVEKNVTNEVILKKPVDQIIAKGPSAPRVYASAAGSLSRGSGSSPGFIWPIKGQITSYYGWRSRGFHLGLDIDGYTGQPIAAAAAGKVVSTGWNGGYGLSVLIDNGNGIATRYSHASKIQVSVGQQVSKGQTIALVGSTGNSTGSHLDFEVIINGNNVNPLNYLP